MSLEEYRSEINEVDRKLSELFQERLKIVEKVALYKKENGLEIYDKNREEQVLIKVVETIIDESLETEVKEFFKAIMNISKDYQKRL